MINTRRHTDRLTIGLTTTIILQTIFIIWHAAQAAQRLENLIQRVTRIERTLDNLLEKTNHTEPRTQPKP